MQRRAPLHGGNAAGDFVDVLYWAPETGVISVEVVKRLFTTDEYHRMLDAGILSDDDRVELIEGEIIEMSPISSRQAACVDRLTASSPDSAEPPYCVSRAR